MTKKIILLVEDDDIIRRSLKGVIETIPDYEIIEASNGVSAVAILSKRKPSIDAAILDIMMTGHGGSVGDYLKKEPQYDNTLIIYHTGLDKSQFDNKILEGALYIHKEAGSIKKIVETLKEQL